VKALLVTGGAGFIGSNFVRHLLERDAGGRVIVLDRLTYAGNPANLLPVANHSRYRFVRGDIVDQELVAKLLEQERITSIVHFAAESHVDRSIDSPDVCLRTNVLGTHALLKAARAAWSNDRTARVNVRFHHVSTDEVYGSLAPGSPAKSETAAYAPSSPYSASKAASDHLVRAYSRTYGLPVTISNCSNNYGPYQFPEKLIPLMLVNALDGKPLPVYGRGENVRDWLYVEDHCRAIEAILERGRVGETYNVGGRNEWRNIDIVRYLCAILEQRFAENANLRSRFPNCPAARGGRIDGLIAFVTDRLGHDWRYAIDATKVERELGFVPKETFETGIGKTVDWYLSNETWWRDVLSGAYRQP
jgi:dTDP-glucose 4,6-dehydratase